MVNGLENAVFDPRNEYILLKITFFQIQDPSRVNVYDMVVFEGPPKTEQKMWPAHCVQGTWGSELHKDLKVILRGENDKDHFQITN
jgi:nicotinamidase-related amidase